MGNLREVVEAGAAFLDRKRPGWDREIDLTKLEMNSTNNCVVSQLFGEYLEGCEKLLGSQIDISRRQAYGFTLPYAADSDDWAQLDREWTRLIASRRTGPQVNVGDELAKLEVVHLSPEQVVKGTQFLDQLVKGGDSTWVYETFGPGESSVSGLGALFTMLSLEMGLTVKEKS